MENNYNRRSNYTNTVDTELQRLIEEIIRNYTRPTRPTRPTNIERSNEDFLTFLYTLRDITAGYNSNMLEYQTNTRLSLELLQNYLSEISNNQRIPTNNYIPSFQRNSNENPIQQQQQQRLPQQRTQTNTTENREHLLSYVVYRPTIRNQDATTLRNFFQNILIRPTREQVNNATELITYNRNLENISQTCPITLEEFQDGDIIRQIKQCKHVFHELPIQNWFRTNVRCPVCRYDIRDFRRERTPELQEEIVQNTQETENNTENNTENDIENDIENNIENDTENDYNDIFQELSNNITQNLRNIISGNTEEGVTSGYLDSSQNFLFEFEIR